MANRAYNVFAKWDQEEAAKARRTMIVCVLATDMDVHATLQEELLRRKQRPFDFDSEVDKTLLGKCILHAADIANPTRPFRTSAPISLMAISEFQSQAQVEKAEGLPCTPYFVFTDFASKCRGEVGFAQFVARPYFAALLDCLARTEVAVARGFDPLSAIDANIEQWKLQMANDDLRLNFVHNVCLRQMTQADIQKHRDILL